MDIAALSMTMSQTKVQESASLSVLKMSMNDSKETAEAMTKMMDNIAVDENLGNKIDVYV
ncbi:MAG: YjfB family protein [Clostridiales bacterium]|nr:YjfB family protein [Clostridiales bacterium]MDY2728854.1 YjfB family protein [Clostridium sp.]